MTNRTCCEESRLSMARMIQKNGTHDAMCAKKFFSTAPNIGRNNFKQLRAILANVVDTISASLPDKLGALVC